MTAWTLEYPPQQRWSPQLQGDVVRITEDGRIRITEQLPVRIIFRFSFSWDQSFATYSPWVKE